MTRNESHDREDGSMKIGRAARNQVETILIHGATDDLGDEARFGYCSERGAVRPSGEAYGRFGPLVGGA